MTEIKLTNVRYEYAAYNSAPVVALDNVNLEINEGEFVALLGHNGSGKSTLAKLLNGLFVPTRGKVEILGMDTSDDSRVFDIRKNVGMVFQNPDNQMIASIVEDDVAFGPENLGIEREEIVRRVDWALEKVEMLEYRHATPFKMSGGQKQRIAIAGVLAMKPKIMVLDESTAMLDPKGRREVVGVAKRLNKEEGMTVILITHFMEEALEADRVVVMDNGVIVMDDKPKEIFRQADMLERIGLGVPVVTRIAMKLKAEGVPIDTDIMNKEELTESLWRLL